MSFAAVHIPEFPVAAWLHNEARLKSRPLVLLRGAPPQQFVASLNAVAQVSGIAHGMSKVQAEAVCAALFRTRDHAEESRAFSLVLEAAGALSPRVQSIASPADEYGGHNRMTAALLLDRSGTTTLFGTARAYAQRLFTELHSLGFTAAVATAPNAEAALLLSRSTDGVVCVEQGDLRAYLDPLPTTLLRCDLKTQALMKRWGIRTLGQLAAVPEDGLVSRLGQGGLRLHQLARGEAPHLLVPEEKSFSLEAALEFEHPLEDLERLLFALSRLLGELVPKAVDHAYGIRQLTATLTLEHAQTHVVRVAPATPTQNRDLLLKLVNLELQAHPPPAEIIAVRLDAEPAEPQIAQAGLFQSQFPDPDRLDLLLPRLRAIAGEHNVGSAELANHHREDAFRMVPFRPEIEKSPADTEAAVRPVLRVLRPPQKTTVWLVNDRPHMLFWQGLRLRVAEAAGPWHASGSWWDEDQYDGDSWDVVTAETAYMLRLELQHATQTWNIVGVYD